MTPNLNVKEDLAGHTPSERYIYTVLHHEDGALSTEELTEATGYSPRTIRTAISGLKEAELVREVDHRYDGRKSMYEAVTVEEIEA